MRLVLLLCVAFMSPCFSVWIPLEFVNDTGTYYLYVGIGTPSQYFNLEPNLSTWAVQVPSKSCADCSHAFDSTNSSTFVPLVVAESGIRGLDFMKAFNVPPLNQTFWQVAFGSGNPIIDGFIGFGYGVTANTTQYPPWFITVARYFNVMDVFTLNYDYKTLSNAKLTIGEIDTAAFSGSIQYIPAISKPNSSYWIFPFSSIVVGDDQIALACSKTSTCYSTIMSTSEYIYGPRTDIGLIVSQLNVTQNCSTYAQLPLVYISIGNETYSIPPEVYVRRVNGSCYPKFAPLVIDNLVTWAFGTSFLQSVYTIYNLQENIIGFAKSVNAHQAPV